MILIPCAISFSISSLLCLGIHLRLGLSCISKSNRLPIRLNKSYEFADEILKDNIVLGILLKADMNKYLIHGKLTEEIYTSEEIKNKLETVSIRMQILPYMKGI